MVEEIIRQEQTFFVGNRSLSGPRLIAGGQYIYCTLNHTSFIITLNLLEKKNGPGGFDRNKTFRSK
ncbi:MAG TPA: hypothetical protein VFR94_18095, partial [Nitrososphaeraceae archaeon]|nr:hypothetical protein [Nitrososphaeraceae archaeon]